MTMDNRQRIEEALIHWRENQADEWRIEYYFDCGSLGVARLFTLSDGNVRYWQCRWLSVEPCPVDIEDLPTASGEWVRMGGGDVEYET